MILMTPQAGFAGEFRLIVSKDKEMREIVSDTGFTPNLITNAGLDHVAMGKGLVNTLVVGTGTAVPNILDTSLEVERAATSSYSSTVTNSAGGYVETTYSGQFAQGAASGNLTEFGAKFNATLWSRSLIKDAGGTPTTITVLSDEFLTVVYKVRLYWPQTDTVFTTTMDIDGVSTPVTITARASGDWERTNSQYVGEYSAFRVYNYPMPAQNTLYYPAGTRSGYNWISTNPYIPGSFQRTYSINLGINECNATIKAFNASSDSLGDWWYELSVPIVKDNTKTLTITVGQSWGRYVP